MKNRKVTIKLIGVLMTAVMILAAVMMQAVYAAALTDMSSTAVLRADDADPDAVAEGTTEKHYLAFASDRHGHTDAVGKAFAGMPSSDDESVEYVSLIGDMVDSHVGRPKPPDGEKPSAPPEGERPPAPPDGDGNNTEKSSVFNTSDIYNEVMALGFSKIRSSEDVSILWADHDAGAVDDAGIVFGNGGSGSGVMKAGLNSDGSLAYYIYGIAYDDMRIAENAEASASAFKDWVDTLGDNRLPIIVLCHMPLHYARGDNAGAPYWNEALNYASTGRETTGSGASVNRNVVFLHGHNHTIEYSNRETHYSGEFYVPAGAAMEIGPGGDNFSRIYYNYTTAGYLKDEPGATLITIDGENIAISKYQDSAVTDNRYDGESRVSGDFATKFMTDGINTVQRVQAYPGIADAVHTLAGGSYTYTGKEIRPEVKVMNGETELTEGIDYAVRYKNNVDAGTAAMIITGIVSRNSAFSGSKSIQFMITRAPNSLNVKGKIIKLRAGAMKKKKKTIKASRALSFASKGEGTISYVKKKGSSKVTINKSNGKVTVKKGLKKGVYKIKVKVIAKGSRNFEKGVKTAALTIKIV